MTRQPKKPGRSGGGTQQTAAQRRLAAQRAVAAANPARRRLRYRVGLPVLAAVLVVAALVVAKLVTGAGGPASGSRAGIAPAALVAALRDVPSAVSAAIGAGEATAPTAISAEPLTAGGRPEVLYIGAEYCPYCAAERWPMTIALLRFGGFTGLGTTTSAKSDGDIATLSFHGARYTSRYLSFVGKETYSNQVRGDYYAPLDKLSESEQALLGKYDAPPYVAAAASGSIPFVDLGGRYLLDGAQFDFADLSGRSRPQIAGALSQASSPVARDIFGAANVITAALCKLTGNAPASVCAAPGVRAAATRLH